MNFLQETQRKSPKLFVFFCVFIVITLLTHVFRVASTPFFIYTMYSTKVPIQDDFSFYIVKKSDGQLFNHPELWNHHKRIGIFYSSRAREVFSEQLHRSHSVENTSFYGKIYPLNSNHFITEYPKWLLRYVEQIEHQPLDSISFYKVTVHYNEHNQMTLKHVKKIFSVSK